ncbi:MAG TPA: cell division protein ZapA [Prolixibacteraceae bacterium]|nr:cell division protein ZapA [Lentimicrobium sp.]HLN73064.1 cell division protein ZapA [Prolixibacteraceae bacterium]
MDELSITVVIADRPYKLKVQRSEEEGLRKAAKGIEEQIQNYASYFEFKDKQDLLAMVALQFAASSIEFESQLRYRDNEMLEKLAEIEQVLTEHLT